MSGINILDWERMLGEQVIHIQKYRKQWLLETASGKWVAKPCRSHAHLRWWFWVDCELRQRGFDRMPLCRTDGRTWLLTAWIDARPASYHRMDEAGKAADLLSRFHQAGRGLLTPPPYCRFYSLRERIESRYRSFSLLLDQAEQMEGELGQLLRRYGKEFLRLGNDSRRKLMQIPLQEWTDWERSRRCLTHRDLASHNVLIDSSGNGWLIDFETADYDAQVGDLWQLLSRTLSQHRWDVVVFKRILSNYESHRVLAPIERLILASLLGFPNEFFREAVGISLNKEGYMKEKTLPYLNKIAESLSGYRDFLNRWIGW
ncbi:phosphotransferase [Melghirimyces algeriensis]|uniref:Spore coat protein, CotS family n=1 Tax=Melghirimyces algeriensis TaxID=910412 RepID=A0A521AU37_9BACL|nr:phosphotransferase [Melghirimyces algeriensis]SMO38295.1 spore coat protein, CotS family [Melghirimyces algeriensis]